jgi:hypothetical protein
MSRRKFAKFAVIAYLLGALAILAAFLLMPHSDVGYLPMVVWALPVTLIGLLAVYWPFQVAFPFMPAALGFAGGHVAFFIPAAAATAWLIWRVLRGKGS